jgi:signal transduction histidine kinase
MEPQSAASRLGTLVDTHRNDIERRWLAGVGRGAGSNANGNADEVAGLRAGLSDYLSGLAVVLSESRLIRRQGAREIWLEVARARGATRARGGAETAGGPEIERLVHELTVLGRVIREIAAERGLPLHGPGAALAEVLTDVLDAAIAAAVRSYVDARDRDARRVQARHVSYLTHELRDPLGTAMLTAGQLRGRRALLDEGALDRLDRCHERLANLIDRVLRTQTFEAEKPACRPAATTLGQLLEGAFDRARVAAADKGLRLRVSFDPHVTLRVDPLLTRVAVQRLVEGAVADTDAGCIEVVVEERRDAIVLDLRDTCAAADAARPELALAKRAVEAQGGSIAAEAGTTARHLRLRLPKQAAEHEVGPEP